MSLLCSKLLVLLAFLGLLIAQGTLGQEARCENEAVNLITATPGQTFLNGSACNDHLIGNAQGLTISGLAGDDLIFLQGGNNTVSGGSGSDVFKIPANLLTVATILDFEDNQVSFSCSLSSIGDSLKHEILIKF